jgi:hypothetical protein
VIDFEADVALIHPLRWAPRFGDTLGSASDAFTRPSFSYDADGNTPPHTDVNFFAPFY